MVKADLHIHTVLSPCGDIEMTPAFIVRRAKEAGFGVIAITDHNSTRQCPVAVEIGRREGVCVVCGAEITTREEAHVVALVDGEQARERLQGYLDEHLIRIPNKPDIFGYQLVVNEAEEVLYEEESLLIGAIDRSIDEIGEFVHSIGGIFFPAHIDKPANSVFSQLGFLPPGLAVDAVEISAHCDPEKLLAEHPYLAKHNLIRSSDAHYPDDFGERYTQLDMEEMSFEALREALHKKA